ncbi:hypothetical protein DESUT3_23000 [Desulfuromonas versatilis]|uniref:CRISPR-associated protein Cas6 C-terminal domain-containing protein n=1 Tax=Desulfuromonas versatilis TaxID=2802975 RepID=A0ABM8HXI2_9BACT|nr:CRISPR system precrRNA processing endoribonuclease RAMP protein Cas6 [Desulfuromonas versatilis]BCR05231.1 hypothetical protein DESUT3_23000 [Desulfuromonas versatilis]
MSEYPDILKRMEFALVNFHLEFVEACRFDMAASMRLRRDLRAALGRALSASEEGAQGGLFRDLFDPPLPSDPLALKRYQRPGPPFALLPRAADWKDYRQGESLAIRCSFWGKGILLLELFGRVLEALGPRGLHMGQGPFRLAGIDALDASGSPSVIWRPGDDLRGLAPPFQDAGWWVDTALGEASGLVVQMLTPARLISRGRPVFKAGFQAMFPFILRRVTSMAYTHCGLELVHDPRILFESSDLVVQRGNRLRWQDWRQLEGEERIQDLGGLMGDLELEGEALCDVAWILSLGSLMNIGKGAAYGAGRFNLWRKTG